MQSSEHPQKTATPLPHRRLCEPPAPALFCKVLSATIGRAVPHARQPHLCATGSPAAAPRRHSGTGDASGSHHCARRAAQAAPAAPRRARPPGDTKRPSAKRTGGQQIMPRATEQPPAFASGSHDNYIVLERIGEGSFGKVYKGRRKHTGQTVALKFIGKHGKSERDLRNLRQEIAILSACLLYTSPSPRDATLSRMPSSA